MINTIWDFIVENNIIIDIVVALIAGIPSLLLTKHTKCAADVYVENLTIYYIYPEFSPSTTPSLWDRVWLHISNSFASFIGAFGIFGFSVGCAFLYSSAHLHVTAAVSLILLVSLLSATISIVNQRKVLKVKVGAYLIYYFTVFFSIFSVYFWGNPIFDISVEDDLYDFVLRFIYMAYLTAGVFFAVLATLYASHHFRLSIHGYPYELKRQLFYLCVSLFSVLLSTGFLFNILSK